MKVKLSELLFFILNKWRLNINNEELLRRIAEYFGVEFSVLGIANFESVLNLNKEVSFSYFLSNSIGIKEKLDDIYMAGAFKESLEKRNLVNVGNYPRYKHAVKEWKDAKVKSVLTAPLIKGVDVFGAIQVVCLDEYNYFDSDNEKDLKLVADIISTVISSEFKSYKILLHNQTEQLHIKISSSLRNIAYVSLHDWLISNLRYVLRYSHADITGFIMPYDSVYCVVDRTGDFTVCYDDFNDDVEDWITYKLFSKNVKTTITYSEAIKRYGLELSKQANILGLEDGIFVPIEYNGQLVASFAYGFKKKIENIGYHKILLKNIGMHLVMSVLSFRRLAEITHVLTKNEEQFLKSLMKVAELRDTYTKGHSERVAYYARLIGEALGKSEREKNLIYTAGLLHDIGKIGIPDSILLKPGRLSKHEFEIVKYHPVFSYEMVKGIDQLEYVADCIKHHHERCDGSGYPDRLKCHQIECCARVLAIADVFDALTSKRTYREKSRYSPKEAIKVMEEMALDRYTLKVSKDILVNNCLQDEQGSNLPQLREIEEERVSVFFKDYLTGADRLVLFREFVVSKIKNRESFLLFVVDIKDLGYINHTYGIDYANKLIEYLAEELLANPYLLRVMRDGADSFVCLCPEGNMERFFSFIEDVDAKVRNKFLFKQEDVKKYSEGLLYKTFVRFPEDGLTFEDLLYKLRLRLKQIRRVHNSHLTS